MGFSQVYCARDAFATLPEGTPEPLDLELKPGRLNAGIGARLNLEISSGNLT